MALPERILVSLLLHGSGALGCLNYGKKYYEYEKTKEGELAKGNSDYKEPSQSSVEGCGKLELYKSVELETDRSSVTTTAH